MMGSYDEAEICKLVGLYLLDKLLKILDKANGGLYRDDGLAPVNNSNGPLMDKLRKKFLKKKNLFKEENLSIIIDTNLDGADFLDVTFNFKTGKYFSFRKPNNNPLYINYKSNCPPPIIKEFLKMINKKIYDLSCNEEEFNKAKPPYKNALKGSGYTKSLKYTKPYENTNSNRNRKILWFNPPFSHNVKTNIGKIFIKLIKMHFPKDHKLRKIFNTSTIKLSYSCMPNMSSVIKQHNQKVLSSSQTNNIRHYNCRNPASCPADGNIYGTLKTKEFIIT